MKKSLIVMTLLLAVSVVGLGAGYGKLSHDTEAVTLVEERNSGDLAAADGLHIHQRLTMAHNLFWDTDFRPGQEPETNFHFTYKPEYDVSGLSNTIEIVSSYEMSASTTGTFEFESDSPGAEQEFAGVQKLLKDVAQQASQGGSCSVTLDYQDYYTYAPFEMTLALPSGYAHWHTPTAEALASHAVKEQEKDLYRFRDAFQEAFRFPVPDNSMMEIDLTLEDGGQTTSFDTCWAPGSGFHIGSTGTASDTSLYLLVEARMNSGKLMDYTQTPGGYAIYRLPLTDQAPTMADLETFWGMPTELSVSSMRMNDDQSRLLVEGYEGGENVIYVVDAASGQMRQRLVVPVRRDTQEDKHFIHTFRVMEDAFIVFRTDGTLTLFERASGGDYEQVCFVDRLQGAPVPQRDWDTVYLAAFNGERLAVVVMPNYYKWEDAGSFKLCVYDRSGQLLYDGTYTSSLALDNGDTYKFSCVYADIDPLTLAWEK